MNYTMKRVPVSMGGPAFVVCDAAGTCVFETKDFDALKAECARLNAGGMLRPRLPRFEERIERQKDGSMWRTILPEK